MIADILRNNKLYQKDKKQRLQVSDADLPRITVQTYQAL